jgi:peptidoglycan hydrolase CwlO-like protein
MPKKTAKKTIFRRVQLGMMGLAAGVLVSGAVIVHADKYDDQINALRQQNAQSQSTVNGLQATASSYQNAIDQLQSQISALEAALSVNEGKQASLQQQITDAQNKITQDRGYLGQVIKAMYVDGQMSTIEELATSKNLSDYVDQEENRTAVQNKIDDLIKQIAAEEVQMQQQKSQLDSVVKTEQQQN